MKTVEERPILPSPSVSLFGWAATLLQFMQRIFFDYGFRINRMLPKDGTEVMTGPITLATYTDAPDTKPSFASYAGSIIYVSDGGVGAKFRGSDGAAWVNLG